MRAIGGRATPLPSRSRRRRSLASSRSAEPGPRRCHLWNTAYLHCAVTAFRAHGEIIDCALLARLAPLGWEHVAITGEYTWEEAPTLDAGGFRPLANLSRSDGSYY